MAIAVAKDAQVTRQSYFDAVKRFSRSKVVGFDFFQLEVIFPDGPEAFKSFSFMANDLDHALELFEELIRSFFEHPSIFSMKRSAGEGMWRVRVEILSAIGPFELHLVWPYPKS